MAERNGGELTDVTPSAFLCYARSDDKHDRGDISTLRERLSGEVRAQTGKEFEIFQDRESIEWGENWRRRIDNSLNAVTFLICILTPSFFESAECRREVEVFMKREAELGWGDLILPVYYITCPSLEDGVLLAQDRVAAELAERQRQNWRDLRHEPIESQAARERIDTMGRKIKEAIIRVTLNTPGESGTTTETSGAAKIENAAGAALRDASVSRIVDPAEPGAYPTIAEAIEAANLGDRILVHPGVYEEPLVIHNAIEVIGEGNRDEIIVQVSGANALRSSTSLGRVANLTLKGYGRGPWFCVHITEGRLELEGCDIIGDSLACVVINDGANPRLSGNRIHGSSNGGGVIICKNGLGTLEENDIFGNALAGIEILEGGRPTVRGNRIHDGEAGGLLIGANGRGTIEDNEIFGNALAGVEIKEGGNPTLRGNRIHDGKESGLFINTNGLGFIEDNEIFGNALAGVSIQSGSKPVVRGNRINRNGYQAISIYGSGGGTFTDNDLRDNTRGAWDISDDNVKNVERSGNIEGAYWD